MGPLAYESDGAPVLFGQGVHGREYSERVASELDAEVARIINEGYLQAKDLLTKHRSALDSIAKKLLEAETLEREEFEQLLVLNGIEPKKKE
jgi:cell division protease FtsH